MSLEDETKKVGQPFEAPEFFRKFMSTQKQGSLSEAIRQSRGVPAVEAEITDGQIINLFKKIVGGDTGAWLMYRKELIALYRYAISGEQP